MSYTPPKVIFLAHLLSAGNLSIQLNHNSLQKFLWHFWGLKYHRKARNFAKSSKEFIQGFDVTKLSVDRYSVKFPNIDRTCHGETLLLPITATQMFNDRYLGDANNYDNWGIARELPYQVLKWCHTNKVDVLGLGAYTKAEKVSKGGKLFYDRWQHEHPGQTLHTRLIHGDGLTAATVAHNSIAAVKAVHGEKPIEAWINGSTSKVGAAVSVFLAKAGYTVRMFTGSQERFTDIKSNIPKEFREKLIRSTSEKDIEKCRLIIIGKYRPISNLIKKYLAKDKITLVTCFSVPAPVKVSDIPKDRGLWVDVENVPVNFLKHHMTLLPGKTFPCALAAFIAALKGEISGINRHEIGELHSSQEIERIRKEWNFAQQIGATGGLTSNNIPLEETFDISGADGPVVKKIVKGRIADATGTLLL